MASTPGVDPGHHRWEASTLTTAPPLLPLQPFYASFMVVHRNNVAGHTAELVVCASGLKLAKKKKV